jgi:hypothetical protein
MNASTSNTARRLFAFAAAAVITAPSLALGDDSSVAISGYINESFENVKASGGATDFPNRNRVESNATNIRVSGREDLGNGLKAWFQVESLARLDNGANSTFASRNSGVGLSGGWGTFLIGRWGSPYYFLWEKHESLGRCGTRDPVRDSRRQQAERHGQLLAASASEHSAVLDAGLQRLHGEAPLQYRRRQD